MSKGRYEMLVRIPYQHPQRRQNAGSRIRENAGRNWLTRPDFSRSPLYDAGEKWLLTRLFRAISSFVCPVCLKKRTVKLPRGLNEPVVVSGDEPTTGAALWTSERCLKKSNGELLNRRRRRPEFVSVGVKLFLAAAVVTLGVVPLSATPLELTVRKAEKADRPGEPANATTAQVHWPPEKTAIIIIDMWDKHHCRSAEARVAEMAPAINRTVTAARRRGVLIIHAPSDCMEFYADTPQRRRAIEAPPSKAPRTFQWNGLDLKHEGPLPDEVATAGCSCDTAEPCGPDYRAWKRQIETIDIAPEDAISDNGQEIYNLLRQRGIEHVIVLGVHTNVCVLGRPFGIRQLVYLGQDVVLCRDLTDSYHRRVAASHFDGLNLIIRHIEQYWCPTITSESLTGRPPFQFAGARTTRPEP